MHYKNNEKRSRLERSNDWLSWRKVIVIGIALGLLLLMLTIPFIYIMNRQIDAELTTNELEYQYKIRRVGEIPQGL